MKKHFKEIHLIILSFIIVMISCKQENKGEPILPAGAEASPDYSVEVNGHSVFVNNHKDYRTEDSRMGYVQFDISGKTVVKITYKKGPVSSCQISPLAYGIIPKIEGNTVTFELDQPRYLIAFFNKGDQRNFLSDGLILFAEPAEASPVKPDDAKVLNIMDYGIDNTGTIAGTELINQAISDASRKPGGGIVYFPRGVYLTGGVLMQSNVHLYIDEGALIQASLDASDHANIPVTPGMGRGGGLFSFNGVENSGILGRGTIDVRGYPELWNLSPRPRFFSIKSYNSSNISIEDITIKNSLLWTIHIIDCENFHSRNVKIINRKTQYWEDVYDIDVSRHVLIENGFALSMDDMWAIKGSIKGERKPSYDITVKGFVAYGFDSGLAIGYSNNEISTESIKDVLFEDIHIVSSLADWGFHITFEVGIGEGWSKMDPKPDLENWKFKDISFEDGGTFLIATGDAKVKNFSFENITVFDADAGYKGIFRGNFADSISFKGLVNKGTPVTNVNELSKVGAGIDILCPVKFIPTPDDAYRFSFEKGLEAYKMSQFEEALKHFNASIEQKSDYGKAYFYRSIINISLVEQKKIQKDETWQGQWEQAIIDMQNAEDMGFFKAKEFKEKNLKVQGWYKGPADQLRRVLFSTEGKLPYSD